MKKSSQMLNYMEKKLSIVIAPNKKGTKYITKNLLFNKTFK